MINLSDLIWFIFLINLPIFSYIYKLIKIYICLIMIRTFFKKLIQVNQQSQLLKSPLVNKSYFQFSNSKKVQEILSQITVQTHDDKTVSIL